jgi:hypothetical protein
MNMKTGCTRRERLSVLAAAAAHSKFLLMRNLNQQIPGTDLYIMKKRRVFKTTMTRGRVPDSFPPEAVARSSIASAP